MPDNRVSTKRRIRMFVRCSFAFFPLYDRDLATVHRHIVSRKRQFDAATADRDDVWTLRPVWGRCVCGGIVCRRRNADEAQMKSRVGSASMTAVRTRRLCDLQTERNGAMVAGELAVIGHGLTDRGTPGLRSTAINDAAIAAPGGVIEALWGRISRRQSYTNWIFVVNFHRQTSLVVQVQGRVFDLVWPRHRHSTSSPRPKRYTQASTADYSFAGRTCAIRDPIHPSAC